MRAIRPLVYPALARLSLAFNQIYAPVGRPSIAPEHLLRTLRLQAFLTIRSKQQPTSNILFRWFIGLSIEAAAWDVTGCWRVIPPTLSSG